MSYTDTIKMLEKHSLVKELNVIKVLEGKYLIEERQTKVVNNERPNHYLD